MKNTPMLKLIALGSAALLLGTASVASAACDVQPDELRIVAFATSDAEPTMVGHAGRAFLVVENRSERSLDLEDCKMTSEYIHPVGLVETATTNTLLYVHPFSLTEPKLLIAAGERAIISLYSAGLTTEDYYNTSFNVPSTSFNLAGDPARVIYTPDVTIEMYAIKSGSNVYLSNDDDEVISSIAYGEYSGGTLVGQTPRIEAAADATGSGFFVIRNSHVLENDEVYYDGTFWTELPIWWDLDADPLAAVPEGVLWPAPLQVPDLDEVICGDLAISGDEVCDTQEGCSDTCTPFEHWECSDVEGTVVCTPQAGWVCDDADPTDCSTVCGDGIIVGTELCDDGNVVSGDGCSETCAVEEDWTCTGAPSVCEEDTVIPPGAVCGNGKVEPGESCDDGNTDNDDGCSKVCKVEKGWACQGEPSTCKEVSSPSVCGDGNVQGAEECDGNVGCKADCTWGTVVAGGRVGSCSAGLGEGAGGGLALLALGLGLVANRRRSRKNAA